MASAFVQYDQESISGSCVPGATKHTNNTECLKRGIRLVDVGESISRHKRYGGIPISYPYRRRRPLFFLDCERLNDKTIYCGSYKHLARE